jgi:hypothetical protein
VRTPAARVGIALAALAAAVALFFVLSGGDDDAATARPQGQQPTAGSQPLARAATKAQSALEATKRKAAKAPQPKIHRIWVREGKAAGGAKRLEFKRGELVRFSVHSKVADEVHIHGFDITQALPANKIVVFAFAADIEGVFEVELHGNHVKIAELRVRP